MTKNSLIVALLLLFFLPLKAEDITVQPGESVQSAINTVAASGGGTVTLAEGTHIITSPVRMKSNVTLQGTADWGSTLKTETDIQMIIADAYGLVNLTIQDLDIVGINSDVGGGIQITSQGAEHQNIKLHNIHCRNTGWGVHIKGAYNLTITDCLFEENGAVGKEYYAHNLYLRRVYGAEVRDSKFINSISSNGVNISYSEDIAVYNCEISGNYFRGIRAADTDGFLIHDCIISDNGHGSDRGGDGIIANSEVVPTTGCEFLRNCVSNNASGGIVGVNGAEGVAYDNNVYENGTDFSLPVGIKGIDNTSDLNRPCGTFSFKGSAVEIPALIEAENFDIGGEGLTYHDVDTNNDGDKYRLEDGVDIDTCSIGGYKVFNIENGEWLLYSINIPSNSTYSLKINYAAKNGDGIMKITFGGSNEYSNLSIPFGEEYSTGIDDWKEYTLIENIELSAGTTSMKVECTGASNAFDLNYFIIEHEPKNVMSVDLSVDSVDNKNQLSWTIENMNADSVFVYRNISNEWQTSTVIENNISDNTFIDQSAEVGIKYFYWVKVFSGSTELLSNVAAFNFDDVTPEIIISPVKVELERDSTLQLSAQINPKGSYESFNWISSNESIATVSRVGVVTAHSAGEVTITAITPDDEYSANCNLKVFNNQELIIIEAEYYDDAYDVKPEITSDIGGGYNVGYIDEGDWMTYSTEIYVTGMYTIEYRVASKSAGGSFTLASGDTIIDQKTFTATGGWQTWKTVSSKVFLTAGEKNFKINVNTGGWNFNWIKFNLEYQGVAATEVSLSKTSLSLITGETSTLSATVLPADSTSQIVTWESSDNTIVSVDENGLVTAIKAGDAIITATSSDGKYSGSCTVDVSESVNVIEYVHKTKVSFYPNPVKNDLNVVFNGLKFKEYCIIDISGKRIKKATVNQESDIFRINLNGFDKGIYMIQFIGEANYEIIRITKE